MLHSNQSQVPTQNEQRNLPKSYYSNLDVSFPTEIVPVFENENGDLVCDARKLHRKLKTKTQFSKWMQRRVQEYDFQEGYDYYPKLTNRFDGWRLTQQYSNDCFNIGRTACISVELANLLSSGYAVRQLELDLRTDKILV